MRGLLAGLLAWIAMSAAADETTVTIPVEPPGGTLYQRVAKLLPPHVGCAVMVLGEDEQGERVVFKRGFGHRRNPPPERRGGATIEFLDAFPGGLAQEAPPVTPRTNFRVSCFTKVFTAAAVLRLADEGALSLDDPATKWLPGLAAYSDAITLRHLLTHRDGLPAYHGLLRENNMPSGYSDLDVLRVVSSVKRNAFAVANRTVYSNTAYVLLGLVVQQASGRPFHEYVADEVLEPLGMTRSVVLVDGLNDVPERAYGHRSHPPLNANRLRQRELLLQRIAQFEKLAVNARGQNQANAAAIEAQAERLRASFEKQFPPQVRRGVVVWSEHDQSAYSRFGGDGALYTSLDDLEALFAAMHDERLPLSDASRELWLEPQTKPQQGDGFGDAARQRSFCYGWMVDERLGERRYSHRGATRGFRQTIQWMPESGRAVVVLMNSVPPEAPDEQRIWDDTRIEELGDRLMTAVLCPSELQAGEPDDGYEDTGGPVEVGGEAARE